MSSSEYNPFVNHIVVELKCNNCKNVFKTDNLAVPSPDWSSETHHNSIETDFCEIACDKCGKEIELTLSSGIYGGDVQSDDAEILNVYEYFPDSEVDDANAQQSYEETQNDIEKCLNAIGSLDSDVTNFVYKLLYSNAITSMEAYLSETLRREVMRNEDTIRRFTETYKPFSEESLVLKDIFSKKEQMPAIISSVLKDLMYHNLGKIKPIFKDALGIDLGSIASLCKAVNIRHDLVHRNGKNFDGNEHKICEQDVRDVLKLVKDLTDSVDQQLTNQRMEELFRSNNAPEIDEQF